jgi:hypothetical protein
MPFCSVYICKRPVIRKSESSEHIVGVSPTMPFALSRCWGTMALLMAQPIERPSTIDQMEGSTMRHCLVLVVVPSLLCCYLLHWLNRDECDTSRTFVRIFCTWHECINVSWCLLCSQVSLRWYEHLTVTSLNSEGTSPSFLG